jgi:hypothetical protein
MLSFVISIDKVVSLPFVIQFNLVLEYKFRTGQGQIYK